MSVVPVNLNRTSLVEIPDMDNTVTSVDSKPRTIVFNQMNIIKKETDLTEI